MKEKNSSGLKFSELISSIQDFDVKLVAQAGRAINISLTIRNWLIGFYIVEYEQNGSDRVEYGEKLLPSLARQLKQNGLKRVEIRELQRYRLFYQYYPQIRETLSPESGFLPNNLILSNYSITETLSPQLSQPAKKLLNRLSFSHFTELLLIEEPLKRVFYEMECIKGVWSVRELRRQISTLYYERSGYSKNKEKLSEMAQSGVEKMEAKLEIRDPYILEFLGLKSKEVMGESDLEDILLDKLQDFLLELGRGFCFEARQKRIIIGDKYFFVDLVFYHRILKCHVLIELKVDEFSNEYSGQLNTYVNWFKKNEMATGDNPPIGILLCTQKEDPLIEYALAGMDNNLFVSKYAIELPEKAEIELFIKKELENEKN